MFLAKEARHFQEIGFTQGDGGPAFRAWCFLADILPGELNVNPASWAGHFQGFQFFFLVTRQYRFTQPKPNRSGIASNQQANVYKIHAVI